MSTHAMPQSAGQESESRANPFEASFDNFKTKRRRTFSGRGKYFANVKQFFNGCKSRVRSLRERYEGDIWLGREISCLYLLKTLILKFKV